eukprot:5278354-Prymnesium_polylepis.1
MSTGAPPRSRCKAVVHTVRSLATLWVASPTGVRREVARQSHGLEQMIIKRDDDEAWRDDDGDGIHDEVAEVRDALWHCAHEIYGIFEYFSVLFSDGEDAVGEPSVFDMSFNAFLEFIRKAQLPTKELPMGEFETIWVL